MSDFSQNLHHMSPERRSYVLRALTEHLEASGESDRLHKLLREHECTEETVLKPQRGRNRFTRLFMRQRSFARTRCVNSWFALQEQERESAAFIADVNRGWKLAETDAAAEIRKDGKTRSIAFATRYALILSSINDIGSGISPPLIGRLIGAGIWTLTQGRTYARQVPALNRRALSLAAVATQTSGLVKHEILTQALSTALAIKDDGKSTETLVKLAPVLCRSLLWQALEAAREITYAPYRAQALVGIVPHLTVGLRDEVVQETSSTIQKIDDEHTRAEALCSLVAYIRAPDREEAMRQILAMIRAVPYDTSKRELITKVAPHLAESFLPLGFEVCGAIGTDYDRSNARLALVSRLAQFGRQGEALQLVRREAGTCSEHSLAQALLEMAPYFGEEQLLAALKFVGKFHVPGARMEAVVGLAPYLSETLLPKALSIVESMKHAIHQIEPLAALSRKFPETKRKDHLEQVLTTAMREYESQEARSVALSRMSPNIPEDLLPLVLSESRRIDDEKRQVKLLSTMAAVLPLGEKIRVSQRALSKAHGIDSARDRFEALANLTPLIAETAGIDEALGVALSIEHPDHCAWALTGVFPRLTQQAIDDTVLLLMQRWRKTRHEAMLPEAFNHLAPYLSDILWRAAVSFAQEKEWASCRGGILSSLVRNVATAEKLRTLLPRALSITEATTRSAILAESARQLARFDNPEEALDLVREATDEMQRVRALEAIVPYLPEPFLLQVMALVEELTFDGRRWSVSASLAPRFAELGQWDVAVHLMTSIKTYHRQALAAARMAAHAPDYDRGRLVEHVLTIVRNAQGEFAESEDWWQGETLTLLAPYLPAARLEEALDFTLNITDPDTRAGALSAVTSEWVRLKPADTYRLWEKSLHRSSDVSRIDLLENLLALTPVINYLGGPETMAEIVDAINDVGEWWPA